MLLYVNANGFSLVNQSNQYYKSVRHVKSWCQWMNLVQVQELAIKTFKRYSWVPLTFTAPLSEDGRANWDAPWFAAFWRLMPVSWYWGTYIPGLIRNRLDQHARQTIARSQEIVQIYKDLCKVCAYNQAQSLFWTPPYFTRKQTCDGWQQKVQFPQKQPCLLTSDFGSTKDIVTLILWNCWFAWLTCRMLRLPCAPAEMQSASTASTAALFIAIIKPETERIFQLEADSRLYVHWHTHIASSPLLCCQLNNLKSVVNVCCKWMTNNEFCPDNKACANLKLNWSLEISDL